MSLGWSANPSNCNSVTVANHERGRNHRRLHPSRPESGGPSPVQGVQAVNVGNWRSNMATEQGKTGGEPTIGELLADAGIGHASNVTTPTRTRHSDPWRGAGGAAVVLSSRCATGLPGGSRVSGRATDSASHDSRTLRPLARPAPRTPPRPAEATPPGSHAGDPDSGRTCEADPDFLEHVRLADSIPRN